MVLKSIEIQGFKSFPERTVISFHEGVTAIVGPNGSGKSNVTDAIRWVLGEQSIRTLRGVRMEDVIFSGTENRRPMSFAEVTMVLDNRDRTLDLDYSEVQVTRRFFRSGESEYLINQTPCRLRDISALFMDTGLGRDGYSIIGQGKVDDILSNRSEDRRRILDEASGIVKFKVRKQETLRKLESTDLNLIRVEDSLNELQSRLEPLANQAEVAKRYLELSERLKQQEIALLLAQIKGTGEERRVQTEAFALIERDLLREQGTLEKIKLKRSEQDDEAEKFEELAENLRQEHAGIQSRIMAQQGEQVRYAEKLQQQQLRLQQLQAELAELANQGSNLRTDLDQRQARADSLQKQEARFREDLQAAEAELAALVAQLTAAGQQAEKQKETLDQLRESLFSLRTTELTATGLLEQNRTQLKENEKLLATWRSELSRLDFRAEASHADLNQLKNQLTQATQTTVRAESSLSAQRQVCEDLNDKLRQTSQTQENAAYRLRTLQKLGQDREGFHETVRRLMQQVQKEPAFGSGVIGPVGELIEVGQETERAIEIALGAAMHFVVTDTEQTAARLIAWLKETRAGRETFLPLDALIERPLDPQLVRTAEKMAGFIGLAADLVRVADRLQPVVRFLLGRILVIEDLEQARAVARATGRKVRLVTLDGEVLNPGGSITGGATRRGSSGLLSRPREIAELNGQLKSLAAEISALEQRVKQETDQLVAAAEAHREAAQSEATVQELLAAQQQDLLLQDTERKQMVERLSGLEQQMGEQSEQILALDAEIAAAQKAIGQAEAEQQQLEAVIAEAEEQSKADQKNRDELRDYVADCRVSLQAILESQKHLAELGARVQAEQAHLDARVTHTRSELAAIEAELAKRPEIEAAFELAIQALRQDLKHKETAVQQAVQQRSALDQQQRDLFTQLEQTGNRISALQSDYSRSEARLQRFDQLTDELKNRLWELYELTEHLAADWFVPDLNQAVTQREVQKLKNQIRQLGAVNVQAIEEFQQVQARHEFVSGQHSDVLATRKKLTEVIQSLETAMKEQFASHFALINENFNEVFAELFNGGQAELILEDEDDVLNSGIDIKAQPPGKRLQRLTLLSGGERCLTAIALLFAILRLRPAPFCVLDEVESSLDDANVIRFTDYIRHYAEESQFILVTHRKGTMEAADRLYGVTMQQRGISSILSLQLTN